MKATIEGDFFLFGGIAHKANGERAGPVAHEECSAGEYASGGKGAGADFAVPGRVFVASHAIDVVVMDHSHERDIGVNESFDDIELSEFMDVNGIGLEAGQGLAGDVGWAGRLEREAICERLVPFVFILAGGRSMDDSDGMTAALQGGGGDEGVGFGAGEGAIAFVDIEESHGADDPTLWWGRFEMGVSLKNFPVISAADRNGEALIVGKNGLVHSRLQALGAGRGQTTCERRDLIGLRRRLIKLNTGNVL